MSQTDSIVWSEIDTVLLDMDGTLLDLNFDTFFWLEHLPLRYAEIRNMDVEQARVFLLHQLQQNRGTIEWYCVDHWSEKLSVDIALLKAEVSHNIGYRPHAELFLSALKHSHIKTVLVTNDHRSSLALKLQQTTLGDYLDGVIVSHDYGVAKEQQTFWHEMQKDSPFDPRKTLFIDDTLAVLNAASEYGISHLRYIDQPSSQHVRPANKEFINVSCFSDYVSELEK